MESDSFAPSCCFSVVLVSGRPQGQSLQSALGPRFRGPFVLSGVGTLAVDYLQLCIGRHPLKQHHRCLAPTVFSRRLGVLHRKTTRQRGQDIALEASAVLALGATGTVRRATPVAGRQET